MSALPVSPQSDRFAEPGDRTVPYLSGLLLRDELNELALHVERALRRGDELLNTVTARRSVDCHRDVLHLRVRIEGISSQIQDAIATLERIEARQPGTTATRAPAHGTCVESLTPCRRSLYH